MRARFPVRLSAPMSIPTVLMRLQAPGLEVERGTSFVAQAPCDVVENILSELTAPPLVPANDSQAHGDNTQGFSRDVVALDAIVSVAGIAENLAHACGHELGVLWGRRQRIAERSPRSGHCYSEGGSRL